MIQKLEQRVIGTDYGCGGASFSEVIDKVNEVIDYINSQPEEKPSEDLNDEIKKFIEEYGYERGEDKLLIAIVARHFAEWQKEQMMKDAMEGTAHPEECEIWVNLLGYGHKYKDGDKVKLIIVKNEE